VRCLIVGGNGQLGKGLSVTCPKHAELFSHDIETLDITERAAVFKVVLDLKPEIIFNAAAYTAVDKAESEEDVAQAVNAVAVQHLADASREVGARFVHVSTDFVFDGTAGMPYTPAADTAPLSAYGRTKLSGEKAAGSDSLIVRTAWVYAPAGGNFVRTMLRLMAERGEVHVVADQIGSPTYAPDLAAALWQMAEYDARGVFHYTDSGVCSWYDFAVAIQEEAIEAGLLDSAVPIIPIRTIDYPTPAKRPYYSVLDKTSTIKLLGGPMPHWRANLRKMIAEINNNG